MTLDPDSFWGKVCLLVIDKIVLGAIIAFVVVAYDRFRTREAQTIQDRAANVQLTFERARLAREFLPFIVNRKEDVILRAYSLREALRTGAVDADATVDIAPDLLSDGLSDDHFIRTMALSGQDGLASIARRGQWLANSWNGRKHDYVIWAEQYYPGLMEPGTNPVDRAQGREVRLWSEVLKRNVQSRGCPEYADKAQLSEVLYGLHFIMSQPAADSPDKELAESRCHTFRLIGSIQGVLHPFSRELYPAINDENVARIAGELIGAKGSLHALRLATVIAVLLRDSGPPQTLELTVPLAKIVAEPSFRVDSPLFEQHDSLKFAVAGVLVSMLEKASPETQRQTIRSVEPVLLPVLKSVIADARSMNADQLNASYPGYGRSVAGLTWILRHSESPAVRTAFQDLTSLAATGKLEPLIFLDQEIKSPRTQ